MKWIYNEIFKGSLLSKALTVFIMGYCSMAFSDEGGMSFWVPGYFGSLAAAPLQLGLSLASLYYHSTLNGGREIAFARQIIREKIRTRLTIASLCSQ